MKSFCWAKIIQVSPPQLPQETLNLHTPIYIWPLLHTSSSATEHEGEYLITVVINSCIFGILKGQLCGRKETHFFLYLYVISAGILTPFLFVMNCLYSVKSSRRHLWKQWFHVWFWIFHLFLSIFIIYFFYYILFRDSSKWRSCIFC